jgi:hypothetical protein
MITQIVHARLDAVIEVEIDPNIDDPKESFDLLFNVISGHRVSITSSESGLGSFVFDAEIKGLGLVGGRKVEFKVSP